MFRKYFAYLRDNPKGYWFKAKWYGWGWVPATWQGWATIFVYMALVFVVFLSVDSSSHSVSDTLYGVTVPIVVLTTLLFVVCYLKGEKPHWSWGPKKGKK